MTEYVTFLLGYPLAILANLSTVFVQQYFRGFNHNILKDLFFKSFIESLIQNKKGVDSIGERQINECLKVLKGDKDKLSKILALEILSEASSISHLRNRKTINKLAARIQDEFNLNHISLANSILKTCLNNYETAFFNQMSTKEGIQYLILLIDKLNLTVAKKEDIDELRKQISEDFKKTIINSEFQRITDLISDEINHPESDSFSEQIIINFKKLKIKIESLTYEQFQVMHYLKHENRVIISGCAGSGKTLLAAEKALRLDRAGIDTLLLTKSIFLANYIKEIVRPSNVKVRDFNTLISEILETEIDPNLEWNEYIEPDEDELNKAFQRISDFKIKYDAIIIDEGQDIKELWWLIIEAISINSNLQILYIFHDDRQSLLPINTYYPIQNSPFTISKNCRNAGEIFEVVKKFHPNAPLSSLFLKGEGRYRLKKFRDNYFAKSLEEALFTIEKEADISNVHILTNETSAKNSMLNGLTINISNERDWRGIVSKDLELMRKAVIKSIEKKELAEGNNKTRIFNKSFFFSIPDLSNNSVPSNTDIIKVSEFATEAQKHITSDYKRFYYEKNDLRKRLIKRSESLSNIYGSNSWADKLFATKTLRIMPSYECSVDMLPLSTLEMMKGLESDTLILFINTINKDILRELYLGTSRAVGYLYIVINEQIFEKVSQLKENHNTSNMDTIIHKLT